MARSSSTSSNNAAELALPPTYEAALAELRAGQKQTHWMWFVLPQLVGLGHSPAAQRYGVAGLAEARAYVAHPVLGPRLRECAAALLALDGGTAVDVLGPVDAMKLRSSMTLFMRAASDEPLFARVLGRFHDGEADPMTDDLLATAGDD